MADENSELARALANLGGEFASGAAIAHRPTWGETRWRGPAGYEYLPLPAKDSLMTDFLVNALTHAPMALRSGRGAAIGRDNAMAGRLERRLGRMERGTLSDDRGITGGRPDLARRSGDRGDWGGYGYWNSSAGLARNRGFDHQPTIENVMPRVPLDFRGKPFHSND